MAPHGLVHVHRGKRGDVEAGEPHVHDDGDFEGVVVALEAPLHVLLVVEGPATGLGAVGDPMGDVVPLLGVLVARRHHHSDLVPPLRPELHELEIDGHGYGARVGDNHCLAGEESLAVLLVVGNYVAAERVYRLRRA